jgi:hypothetical protein
MTTKKNTSVLFVSVTEGRDVSSISNAISAAKMQLAVIQKPIELEFRFEKTLADAIDHFHANRAFDVLVAVDNLMGYPGEWVVENALGHADKHVITGIFPLPGVVDWDRIRAKAADDREPNFSKGHVYNISLDGAAVTEDSRFVVVPEATLSCVVIKRAAIDDIAARHPELAHDRGLHVHAPTLADGKKLTADQTFCRLYGKPIHADLQHPCSSFGTLQYAGICALRKQLR